MLPSLVSFICVEVLMSLLKILTNSSLDKNNRCKWQFCLRGPMVVRVRAVVLLSSETRSASEKENYTHSLNGDYKRAVSSLASSGAG